MLTIRAVTRLIGLGTSVRITNYKPLSVRHHQQPMTSSYNLEFSPRKVIFFFDLFSLNLRGEHTKDQTYIRIKYLLYVEFCFYKSQYSSTVSFSHSGQFLVLDQNRANSSFELNLFYIAPVGRALLQLA